MTNIAVRVPPSVCSMKSSLRDFFEGMIFKLDKNSHKGTVDQNDILTMVDLLRGELDELVEQFHKDPNDSNILRESQDTANYAFLIFHALRMSGVQNEMEQFIFEYYRVEPEEGKVYVRKTRAGSPLKVGQEIRGSAGPKGRRFIKVQGRGHAYQIPRSHLVWFAHCGSMPTGILDHKDRDCSNDKISNLKDSTFSENNLNTLRSDNRRLPPHVTQYKPTGREHLKHWGKYVYQKRHRGENIRIAYFDTPEEASLKGEASWNERVSKVR